MKQLKLTFLFTVLMSMAGINAFAYHCKVDGICYNVNSNNLTATVTYSGWPYNNEYTGHYGGSGLKGLNIQIPSTISYNDVEYTVTAIGDYAFCDSESSILMASISIPPTVTSIGKQAFRKCEALTSFTIPNSVTSIGNSAFGGCNNLTSVVSKITIPFIFGSYAFDNIGSNCTLTVPSGTKAAYIAAGWTEDVFKGGIMESSSNITFVDSNVKAICVANWDTNEDGELSEAEAAVVTDLGSVFKQNTTITSFDELQYFTGLTAIGASAFLGCSSLTNIGIPNSVTIIGSSVFEGCKSLTSVNIPCSVTTLENRLFYSCEHLKKVVFPNSIKSIPANLYLGYTNKPSYGFTSIDGTVENIHVPSSVTWIGIYAINQCDTVVVEDGSTDLTLQDRNADDGYWDGALSHVKKLYVGRNMGLNGSSYSGQVFCALNSSFTELSDVIFGPLVTRAFTGTSFRSCSHVSSVTCLSKEPFPSPDFYQIPQTAVLHVPLGSKQKYESAQGWSNFKGIQEVTEVTITLDDTEMVYAGDFDLDFSQVSGLQAFTAGDYDAGTSSITFNPVQIVSAGKGVILRGAKGTYTVPCANIEPTLADPLCGTISGKFIRRTQDDSVNYYYDKVEHVFKPVDAAYGCQLSRNEAYLTLPSSSMSSEGIITPQYKEDKPEDDKKCATPTISYANGKVLFTCETEGVEFVPNATLVGSANYENGEMTLPSTYRVSVYARKDGYADSDTAVKEVTVTGSLTGDVNSDGKVTITDAVSVVNIILNNGETAAPALETLEVGEPE